MVMLKNAARLNGLTGLVITKLDVLDDLEEIKICTGYEVDGKTITHFPPSINALKNIVPIYETLPGWKEKTSNIREYDKLPEITKSYLKRIEELSGVNVKIVSVGPDREATMVLKNIF